MLRADVVVFEYGSAVRAQGGIVCAGLKDSPDLLARNILSAGGGEAPAAAQIATERSRLVRELLVEELGVPFGREPDGFEAPLFALEGAHSVPRILRHGDSRRIEAQRAPTAAIETEPRINLLPGTEALELTVSVGRCIGVHAARYGEGRRIA